MWVAMRAGFRLDTTNHPRIAAQLRWYAHHQKYLDRVFERARPYLHYILKQVQKRHMPTEIALLPVVESAFRPFAYSHVRAAGLWQFIPSTGRRFGLKQDWWYDGRRDVIQSTKAALDYLQQLHDDCNNDWLLALAAYNSGEGTVLNAIRRNERRGRPTDFWHLDLPRETRNYVPKLLALREVVEKPKKYGVQLEQINDAPYLTTVHTGGQIDLGLAAKLAGISLKKLYHLNPGFNRWATAPNGPHRLVLPIDAAERFETRLAKLPKNERMRWRRHKVHQGETLGGIAQHYHTTVALLRKVNKLHGNLIRAGHHLLIPVASRRLDKYAFSEIERQLHAQARLRHGRKVHYTVRSGDSLWVIARRYHVGVRELARWNGMATRDALHIGQKLVLWLRSGGSYTRTAHAAEPARVRTHNGHYTVRKGDSLWVIAQRYHVGVHQLAEWNGLAKRDPLHIGEKLVVRPGATKHHHRRRAARATASATHTGIHRVHYTVRRGDSLWVIAHRYNVNVGQLAAWNGLAKRDALHIGQKLVLWPHTGGGHRLERTASATGDSLPSPIVQAVHYTVHRGDSLSAISQRFRVSVNELRRWNDLHKHEYLQPGQELKVFVDVTRQADNS
ncbi:MAG TPA: LysM peptidoglycan-binding domain-containing protein [Gammaproteobacteria bacterium]|nr:LysM peptidoglycan-binding domain-containing protein [Gammaproteobacteria bacterium]